MREIIIENQDEKEPEESLYERRAHYYVTDQMGIIHHSNYIRWFEEARMNFMEEIGYSYANVEALGIMIPVLSASCDYKTMVHYNDIVDIYTKITRFNGVKMFLSYRAMDHETGELRCSGETSHCFLDKEYKPIRMKRSYPELYEILMSHVAAE